MHVDDAQAADQYAIVAQRHPGIEADMRFAKDERVRDKAFVLRGVGDDQGVAEGEGMFAEGQLGRDALDGQALSRNEAVIVAVDQRDQGDGRVEDVGGQRREVVETVVRHDFGNVGLMEGRIAADIHIHRQTELTHTRTLIATIVIITLRCSR